MVIKDFGRLIDISVVAFPAYTQTEIKARAEHFEVQGKGENVMEKLTLEELKEKYSEELNEYKKEIEASFDKEDEDHQEDEKERKEEMEVLKTEKEEIVVDKKEIKEIQRNAFYAKLGVAKAEEYIQSVKERATTNGLTNLLESVTDASAKVLIPEQLQEGIVKRLKDMSNILSKIKVMNVPGLS